MLRLFKAVRFQIFRIRTTTSQESAGSIGRLWNALTSSSLSNSWSHQPQIAHAELSEGATPSSNIVDLMDWFDGFLHMGVPKSKVSPSRKRMKHGKFVPDRIEWMTCEKCGEPKRPHRICTDHIEVCALTPEQWEAEKQKRTASGNTGASAAQSSAAK